MSEGSARLVRDVEIANQLGIHARPAALFAKTASLYEADVTVVKGDRKVSGKSIMGLMTLVAPMGTRLRIVVEGADAQQAMDDLVRLVESRFAAD